MKEKKDRSAAKRDKSAAKEEKFKEKAAKQAQQEKHKAEKQSEGKKKGKRKLFLLILLPVLLVLGGGAFAVLHFGLLDGLGAANDAEETVVGMFDSFQNKGQDAAKNSLELSLMEKLPVPEYMNLTGQLGSPAVYRDTLFSHLDYEILTVEKISSEEVNVSIKLTALQAESLMNQFLVDAMSFVFSDAFSEKPLKGEALDQKMDEIFRSCVKAKNAPVTENELTLLVTKKEDQWKVVPDESFIKALYGEALPKEETAEEGGGHGSGSSGEHEEKSDGIH